MFLYNTTIGIDLEIENEWIQYMKEVHIPAVMSTGMFVAHKMYKVLHDEGDGTVSYSVQYFATTIFNVQQYLEKYGVKLVEEHRMRFMNRHVVFQTLLEEI